MTKTVRKLRTRAKWAARIRAAHKETVSAFLKLGRILSAAKDALPHGEFLKMIEDDLPFTASTAQRLMKIAADPKIANAARAQLLPPAWGALYELTKLPEETFEQAVASGAINPKTTRKEAKALIIRPLTKDTSRTISSPSYVFEKEEPRHITSARVEAAEATEARVILQTLETVVTELDQHVRRHGLTPAIKAGIRAATNALSSMIGKGNESVH